MAIAPADGQDFAKAIKDVYEYTEQIILQKIAKRVASGGPAEDPEHWLERKLAEVRRHEAEMDRIIRQLAKAGPQAINDLVVQAYLSGIISADSDLVGAGIAVPLEPLAITPAMMADPMNVVATFGATHTAALASITAEAMGGLQGAHVMMLRQARDGYRDVITDVARGAIAGVDTRLQATQKAISKFADQGIGVFKDKNGKQWDIAVYAEMATRTAMAHAHVQGHINRMVQQGRDLVIVSHHSEPSDLCAPHEGKVYSISGNDKRYKALSWAIADGLFHPNCRHTINAYIEGLTEVPKIKADPEGYKKRQKQRHMETQVRKWKKRQATAVHPTEIAKSEAKVKEWQKALREYTKEHDLGRKYSREKVYARTLGKGEDTGGVRVPPTKPAAAVGTMGGLVKVAKGETIKESKAVIKAVKPTVSDALMDVIRKSHDGMDIYGWAAEDPNVMRELKELMAGMDGKIKDKLDKIHTDLSKGVGPRSNYLPDSAKAMDDFEVDRATAGPDEVRVRMRSDGRTALASAPDGTTIDLHTDFWDMEPLEQEHVISHEVGHIISNVHESLARHILDNPQGALGRVNTKLGRFEGVGGTFTPEESWAEAYATYHVDPTWLIERFPKAYDFVGTVIGKIPDHTAYRRKALRDVDRLRERQ